MYTLLITSAGTEYTFNELTASAVKHLIENTHRVTEVTVLRNGEKISDNELIDIIYGIRLTSV